MDQTFRHTSQLVVRSSPTPSRISTSALVVLVADSRRVSIIARRRDQREVVARPSAQPRSRTGRVRPSLAVAADGDPLG
eukprot:2573636-Rhodomonas_salina.1